MVVLSEQANSIANQLKEFDIEDFELWYSHLHKITIVGTDKLIQYIDMKQRGLWKDKEFIMGDSNS